LAAALIRILIRREKMKTNQSKLVLGVSFAVALMGSAVTQAALDDGAATWEPSSSEKLVRLPVTYIDKTIQQDFLDSPLASSIAATDAQIAAIAGQLRDLKDAMEGAEGENLVELKHQFLEMKTEYVELMLRKQALDSQGVDTRIAIYEDVLEELQRDGRFAADVDREELQAAQRAAKERMQRSVASVDAAMEELSGYLARVETSKYEDEYATNLEKLEKLKRAVNEHASNASPVIDGMDVSRDQYLRHLIAMAQAERAILEQEELMLSYMAKLVALDAMSLEQEITEMAVAEAGEGMLGGADVAEAADFFIDSTL
jgi:hypothetical protein